MAARRAKSDARFKAAAARLAKPGELERLREIKARAMDVVNSIPRLRDASGVTQQRHEAALDALAVALLKEAE